MDFYNLIPKDLMTLNLKKMSQADLKELAYFIWSVYPEEEELLSWRKDNLLPLITNISFDEED